jgi:uncharacterized NAD(P)/FAD-binding protein YdhS
VHDVVKTADRLKFIAGDGTFRHADVAVLAVGNPPPRSLAAIVDPDYLIDDPWDAAAVRGIARDTPVVIVGSGQTAIDLTLAVASNGHRSSITLLSRRDVAVNRPYLLDTAHIPHRLRPFLRWLRREARLFTEDGGDWRAVVNAVRPHTQRIWYGFSAIEKRRFFEHIAPFWYLHRSRFPPQTVQRLSGLLATDQAKVVAGRITGVTPGASQVMLHVRPRGQHDAIQMPAGAVINCTGPYWDV